MPLATEITAASRLKRWKMVIDAVSNGDHGGQPFQTVKEVPDAVSNGDHGVPAVSNGGRRWPMPLATAITACQPLETVKEVPDAVSNGDHGVPAVSNGRQRC